MEAFEILICFYEIVVHPATLVKAGWRIVRHVEVVDGEVDNVSLDGLWLWTVLAMLNLSKERYPSISQIACGMQYQHAHAYTWNADEQDTAVIEEQARNQASPPWNDPAIR